ncbi:sigma-E factor regulatory protein RseB domain-containing protein [Paenibacillus sp. AN1007]|uniref:Sigma-E factor regulatory protein RseB domain-containing protein n=1 Tax=Paenibacillus sp. AN1007 TaxID=3151385 RepID=A0AAU8N9D6_9BACL
MIKNGWKLIGAVLIAGSLFAGCAEKELLGMSGDDMIEKIITAESEPASYYAEGVLKMWTDEKITNTIKVKEWVDGKTGQQRVETDDNGNVSSAVHNGSEVLIYEKEAKTAFSMDSSAFQQEPNQTQKQMLVDQLERMRDTHNVKMLGQEKLQGQEVVHIELTPKDENSLSISSEYWINPKKWMIVKATSTYGDTRSEVLYDRIDYNPEFTDETFKLDIPADVEVKKMNDVMNNKEVSLEEAEKAVGGAFLQYVGQDMELSRIELTSSMGEHGRDEVTLYYVKDNKPEISMTVFTAPEENVDENLLPEEKKVSIRDTEGSYMSIIRNLSWSEKGMRYSIMGENDSWTVEKLQAWAEALQIPKAK